MAPNKFATMIQRKTNRITLVLIYVVLEWALIFFLLLNSLFSYLIIKFAHYFGLKPPCLFCSRLDHIFEPHNPKSSYRELFCKHHAIELSRSGYCFNHSKLVESHFMCEDCSSSHQHKPKSSYDDCMVVEKGDANLRCSCCGVTINCYSLSPRPLIKPSSDVFEDTQKAYRDELLRPNGFEEELDQNSIDSLSIKELDRDILMGPDSDLINEDGNYSEGFSFWHPKESYSMVQTDEEEGDVELKEETKPILKFSTKGSYTNETVLPQPIEFYIDLDDYQLVPVELVNLEMEQSNDETQADAQADALDVVEKLSPMIEDSSTEQGQELEIKKEIDIKMELDRTDIKELTSKQDQEEGKEIKREVGDALVLHANKVAEMLPTIQGEEEATRTEFNCQVVGDQACDVPVNAIDDQLTDEMEFSELNSNIPVEDFEDICYIEDDETKFEDLATKQGQEPEIKTEIGVEVESDEIKMKELSSNKGDEKEIQIVVLDASTAEILRIPTIEGQEELTRREVGFQDNADQPTHVHHSAIDNQVADETELDVNIPVGGDVCHTENDKTKGEDFLTKQGEELETTKLDETKTKELSKENGHHEEEKPEIDDVEILDTNKIEVLPIIQDQTETAGTEISFQDSTIDDQVTEEIELNQLNAVATSVCGDVCKSLEITDKRQVAEPFMPCKEEYPYTNIITCQASTSSSCFLENGDCEPKQTDEIQILNDTGLEVFEQSLEGSVATFEELKSVLKSERKAFQVLYAELEEERHAAAIATNQTMAMISRLQEEKATIEMEALQYQRIMEEQSEYDQEALQLMNEILVKREKELQEAENELGIFRKKVKDYEERERMRLSMKLNYESRDEDSSCRSMENGHHEDTSIDAILNLQDSFSDFENERLSILEQLKFLEEKLCTLNGENGEEFQINGKHNGDSNGTENGSSTNNGKYHEKRMINGQKPKQLLPLFDAAELESDDELSTGIKNGSDPVAMMHKSPLIKFELENERLEEEVAYMYERLHALEADRQFVKNCIGSLTKGERGVNLLQEILQRLRDLKNLELQARNMYSL